MVAVPFGRHIGGEVGQENSLRPDSLDCKLRPHRYAQIPHLILVEEALLISKYGLHELK